ncbi:MAG TPA: arsenite methyltransferase [Methylomirabilota bacterium]|nr:arsenite methyltransferase [Methylomirabilota bacterium]
MKTIETENDAVRSAVREHYGKVATRAGGCGCVPTCCSTESTGDFPAAAIVAKSLGYSANDTTTVPDGVNLGLGCGNPLAIASLLPGQTVLDLGSGAGFDAFLAARAVGGEGRVIGVDMTPEMISKARTNAARGKYSNVEFRLGEIENPPVADNTVDVIISNCVINLSPDKSAVFREAFRVLKPGGRIAVSDIVALQPIPETMRHDLAAYSGCVSGAVTVQELRSMLEAAGFRAIEITPKPESRAFIQDWFPGRGFEDYIACATIQAVKSVATR